MGTQTLHHGALTLQVIGHVEQSRGGGVKERVLGFDTAHGTESVDEGSGHRLLQVAQHWQGCHRHRLP